jgi:hypothetical protein
MPVTLATVDPATARSRPARLAGDIRAPLYQAIADLAETALWLPGRYAAEHDRAADLLARMAGDLARAATALRGWPAYPLARPQLRRRHRPGHCPGTRA